MIFSEAKIKFYFRKKAKSGKGLWQARLEMNFDAAVNSCVVKAF